jgi:hypothetical protein
MEKIGGSERFMEHLVGGFEGTRSSSVDTNQEGREVDRLPARVIPIFGMAGRIHIMAKKLKQKTYRRRVIEIEIIQEDSEEDLAALDMNEVCWQLMQGKWFGRMLEKEVTTLPEEEYHKLMLDILRTDEDVAGKNK